MKVTPLELPGLVLIELTIRRDARGFFAERFHAARFEELRLPTRFVQDNHSRSIPGVLRGLHYQFDPPQGKLVGVTRGRVWDVAVDIRPNSPTFGKHLGMELSDESGLLLWIPAGFAHGFCVLGAEPADIVYKLDSHYNPHGERGLAWNDPDLAIPWPVTDPLVSEKDQKQESFASYRVQPAPWSSQTLLPGV
jgi:dTDP-4-dehydrorhamnose 3,5-epimerase